MDINTFVIDVERISNDAKLKASWIKPEKIERQITLIEQNIQNEVL